MSTAEKLIFGVIAFLVMASVVGYGAGAGYGDG